MTVLEAAVAPIRFLMPLIVSAAIALIVHLAVRSWPMSTPLQTGVAGPPRVYQLGRAAWRRRVGTLSFISAFVVIELVWNVVRLFFNPEYPPTAALGSIPIFLLLSLVAGWAVIRTATARFILDHDSVGTKSAFGERWVRKDDIAGVRLQDSYYPAVEGSGLPFIAQKGVISIVPRSGRRLLVPVGIQVDPMFDAWIAGLPVVGGKSSQPSAETVGNAAQRPQELIGPGRIPYVTIVLLAIMVVAFIVEIRNPFGTSLGAAKSATATRILLGSLVQPLVFQKGQWFRVVTSIFLHQNVAHIVMNGVVMAFAGLYLERRIGHLWMLALFLGSGIAGSFMSMALNPPTLSSVGASGAIMGMLAAILVVSFRQPAGVKRTRQQIVAARLLVPALLPNAASQHIDIGAHLGGAIGGAILALVFLYTWPRDAPLPVLRRVAMGIIAAAAVLLSVGLKSGIAEALTARGDEMQSYDAAFSYYDRALALDPKLDAAYNGRGVIRFVRGDYDGAAEDFGRSFELNPKWPYGAILLHLAHMHRGENDFAELARNTERVDAGKWPAPVLAFNLGKLSDVQVLAAARAGDKTTQDNQTCEAVFYLGEYDAFHSQIGDAKILLQRARDTCPKDFIEYKLANAEIARIGP